MDNNKRGRRRTWHGEGGGGREGFKPCLAYLIPALNSRRDRIENDGVIQSPGVLPPVRHLLAQRVPLRFVELLDGLEECRVLRDESALFQQREDVFGQVVFLVICCYLVEEFYFGDAFEGVLDLALEVLGEFRNGLFAFVVVLDAVFVDPGACVSCVPVEVHAGMLGAMSLGWGLRTVIPSRFSSLVPP